LSPYIQIFREEEFIKIQHMKRIITLIIYMALILIVPACGKSDEVLLKPGIYILQDFKREVPGDFTITIYEDGTFQSYETPVSSYIGMGHYSIEKDIVTLKEDASGCTGDINYYQMIDGNLSFISKDSANYHFVPLENGALFTWTADAGDLY
jgi:hypothetical protein